MPHSLNTIYSQEGARGDIIIGYFAQFGAAVSTFGL